jgi:hypothetical protein
MSQSDLDKTNGRAPTSREEERGRKATFTPSAKQLQCHLCFLHFLTIRS